MKHVKYIFFLLAILFVSVNTVNAGWITLSLRKGDLKGKSQSNITKKNEKSANPEDGYYIRNLWFSGEKNEKHITEEEFNNAIKSEGRYNDKSGNYLDIYVMHIYIYLNGKYKHSDKYFVTVEEYKKNILVGTDLYLSDSFSDINKLNIVNDINFKKDISEIKGVGVTSSFAYNNNEEWEKWKNKHNYMNSFLSKINFSDSDCVLNINLVRLESGKVAYLVQVYPMSNKDSILYQKAFISDGCTTDPLMYFMRDYYKLKNENENKNREHYNEQRLNKESNEKEEQIYKKINGIDLDFGLSHYGMKDYQLLIGAKKDAINNNLNRSVTYNDIVAKMNDLYKKEDKIEKYTKSSEFNDLKAHIKKIKDKINEEETAVNSADKSIYNLTVTIDDYIKENNKLYDEAEKLKYECIQCFYSYYDNKNFESKTNSLIDKLNKNKYYKSFEKIEIKDREWGIKTLQEYADYLEKLDKFIDENMPKPVPVRKTAVKSVKPKRVEIKKYVKPVIEIKEISKPVPDTKYNGKIISGGIDNNNVAK